MNTAVLSFEVSTFEDTNTQLTALSATTSSPLLFSSVHFLFKGLLPVATVLFFQPEEHQFGLKMSAKYVVSAVLASFALAYAKDYYVADKKVLGGTTPTTVANKEWWEETDRKFQAWPRTAGPPVVMNPISRQNFIVKAHRDN